MDLSEITTMLGTIVGIITPILGAGAWKYRKQNRRLKEAETKLAEVNVDKAKYDATNVRINDLHTVIDVLNKNEVEQSQRIAELNHALNVKEDELRDKTVQIRRLTERSWESEQELNRANERITVLTEERDQERADKEYYKQWKCIKSHCNDPEGRRPPNSKLADQVFVDPENRRHGKAGNKINLDKQQNQS